MHKIWFSYCSRKMNKNCLYNLFSLYGSLCSIMHWSRESMCHKTEDGHCEVHAPHKNGCAKWKLSHSISWWAQNTAFGINHLISTISELQSYQGGQNYKPLVGDTQGLIWILCSSQVEILVTSRATCVTPWHKHSLLSATNVCSSNWGNTCYKQLN